jgi:hypothetical protein
MIDEQLIVAIVQEFGNVTLAPDGARALAADMATLAEVLHRERDRLAFEDAPQSAALPARSE